MTKTPTKASLRDAIAMTCRHDPYGNLVCKSCVALTIDQAKAAVVYRAATLCHERATQSDEIIGPELSTLGDDIHALADTSSLEQVVAERTAAAQDHLAGLRTFLGNMRRDASEAEDPELNQYVHDIEQYCEAAAAALAGKEGVQP